MYPMQRLSLSWEKLKSFMYYALHDVRRVFHIVNMSKKATEKEVEKARIERKWKHMVNVITAFQSKIQVASQGGILIFSLIFSL